MMKREKLTTYNTAMGGDKTTTSTNATDTTSDLLSYPTVEDQVEDKQEVAAIPTQQVGFVPQKDLDVKSKPIQAVETDAEKNRAELEALIKKQAVKETPIPTVAPEVQPTQIEPAPVAQPVATVEQVPTQTPSIPQPVEKTQPKPVPVVATQEVAQVPIAEPAPTQTAEPQPVITVEQTQAQAPSILDPEVNEPTDAELRGQQLAALAQGETIPVGPTASIPTVGAIPEVTATPQPTPVATTPAQIENEPEVAPMVAVQQYEPTQTSSQVPHPAPEPQELPTHPFAEVEQEPTPTPATTTSTPALEARIAALEQKIDTLIAIISKWV